MKVKSLFFLSAFLLFVSCCWFLLNETPGTFWQNLIAILVVYLLCQAILYAWGFYNFYLTWTFNEALLAVFYILFSLVLLAMAAVLVGWEGLCVTAKASIFYLPLEFLLRYCFKLLIMLLPRKKIAFIGESALCIEVANYVASKQTSWVLAAFFTREKSASLPVARKIFWLSWTDICLSLTKLKVDLLVWEDPLPLGGFSCLALPKEILNLTCHSSLVDFIVATHKKVPVEVVRQAWLDTFLQPVSYFKFSIKRIFDLFLCFSFLPLILPIMLLVAFLTKITSSGNILYTQLREGYLGKVFTIYKFRSMNPNAEEQEAKWAQNNDTRVTSWGRIMRKLRLDELPQIWNIIKGDMSFVGPRPERPEFTEILREKIPFYTRRNRVRPGLTGWAQVNYPYGASVEDALRKTEYDLYYVHNPSLWMDCKILIKTVKVILTGQGQ